MNAIGGEKEMTKTNLKILWSQTYSIDSIPIGGYVVPQRLCFFSLSFFFELRNVLHPLSANTQTHTQKTIQANKEKK